MIKFSILPLILLTIAIQLKGQVSAKISVNDLRNDFIILRTTLEEIHPNLYRYISKQKLDRVADSIFATISTELTMVDFYRRIAPIVALIKNGHTVIRLPNSYQDQTSLLPLRLVTFENKVYIRNDFSSQSNHLRGLEIKGINGVSIQDIIKQVIPYISLDGFNEKARIKAAIEDDLSYYHNYKFGESAFMMLSYMTASLTR